MDKPTETAAAGDAQARAAATCNAAADTYDDPANAFWERFGRCTVERLNLEGPVRVLDVCCGSGASAIAAAERVQPDGRVLGIDLAEQLLKRAREKASRKALANVEFRLGDMLDPGVPAGSFDAVVCVFGIFFVPDMAAAIRALVTCTKPGGTIAVTTWGPRLFEPMNTVFWNAVRAVRPDLDRSFNPWERISDPAGVRALFADAGVDRLDAAAETASHPLRSADDWWALVMGSGYRGTLEQMREADRGHVQQAIAGFVAAHSIRSVETNVIYGSARRAL
jgi:ubiquinone/menaquinone biosynthesis C-methylase UbiE